METHMWTQSEKIDVSNKVAPGCTRVKRVVLYFENAFSKPNLFVAAGRNGQILDIVETSVESAAISYAEEVDETAINDYGQEYEIKFVEVEATRCSYIAKLETTGKITLTQRCR